MSIYRHVDIQKLRLNFDHFDQCANEAPNGVHDQAKAIREVIGKTVDSFMASLRELGLQVDTCDRARAVEAMLYAYAKESNPDYPEFYTAEGFGEAMNGEARERVLAQSVQNRDFLQSMHA
jgi:hypothetical protein